MSTFKPGDKVRVHIGGKDNDPTGFEGEFVQTVELTGAHLIDIAGKFIGFPDEWLEPVTPPCPWTERGTVLVTAGISPGWGELFRLNSDGWYRVNGDQVDYEKHIAPFNPVRLVPAQTALRDVDGDLWLPVPGRDGRYVPTKDNESRDYIERNYGPVSEVSS